jgi:hypothetical protein
MVRYNFNEIRLTLDYNYIKGKVNKEYEYMSLN